MRQILSLLGRIVRRPVCWLMSPAGVRTFGELFFQFKRMRRSGETDLARIESLLLVRLDDIGDVVITTPLLRELRNNLPKAWISLVVKPALYNLMENCPYVDEVLTYDWQVPNFGECNSVGLRPHLERHRRGLRLARRHLWKRRFDLAILPRWDEDYYYGSFVAYLSGAAWRVGYSENNAGRGPRIQKGLNRLLTHVIEEETPAHEVERGLNVLSYLKGKVQSQALELWIDDSDGKFADQILEFHGVAAGELLFAFSLGAGEPKRIWPTRNFVDLAEWLTAAYGARIVLLGGPGEVVLADEFRQALGDKTIDVVGKATLRQTTALLRRCRLFVGNDSGPMHMAAATGTPVIEISCHPLTGAPWHRNSPLRFGPRGDTNLVFRPATAMEPCADSCISQQAHCILGVDVERVKNRIREQFNCKEHFMTTGVSDYAK